ncbi:MAG: L,D-transpeptidase family protein [Rhodospirillaceae bacterium]|jgi:L,D-peptidoglycan transpeptidase YkuD (ErfK/YbiS/YcfS/YnhG family)|nr:L,D-transpeptidase family protein [Rhodospirillales bacterium]MBT3904670.1 L,D-transpeptidase family protein [Rhodospirillaceae bacterium]MBT4701376.1 L,D-transpeptidase family protein [Rhodospirillaceae bacterium]MBT5036204.1 L,D-transpeptidase family protein [Rhodospirillaceae bacterium]MBT6220732.1 L,D-transpeptidase family protein [Rhodospirillaceae bacterium]
MDILVKSPNVFSWQGETFRCALGRGGVVSDKSEGDGGTPTGRFALRQIFFRPDRLAPPKTILPIQALQQHDGWCDDLEADEYNTLIQKPFSKRHEDLWRDDLVYDVIVVLGYNDDPVVRGKGSAIFLHVAKPDYSPTEGCVALSLENLLHVLKTITPETRLLVSLD